MSSSPESITPPDLHALAGARDGLLTELATMLAVAAHSRTILVEAVRGLELASMYMPPACGELIAETAAVCALLSFFAPPPALRLVPGGRLATARRRPTLTVLAGGRS